MLLENIIEAVCVTVLSVVSSVHAKEGSGNSICTPDVTMLNCSFNVSVNKFASRIYLCSLKGNVFPKVHDPDSNAVSQRLSSGGNLASIKIHRYYCINPFGGIRTTANTHNLSRLPDLESTNCPLYSTSCLVSKVTFPKCDNNQDDNGVCYNIDPQITADSYGYEKRWKAKACYPPVSSESDGVQGSTAFITMQGGSCYYCDNVVKKKLSTVIRFYCDERIMGKGTPTIQERPTKSNPEVLLDWYTSAACYEFIPNEKCPRSDFSDICKKNFSTPIGCHQDHQYHLPPSANNSISLVINPTITYTFGFCAKDVSCPTTDSNVMICEKKGEEFKPLALYSDSVEFIARPTGFVTRIKDNQENLKAIISFECSESSISRKLTVLGPRDDLPILLTLKHRSYCPYSQQEYTLSKAKLVSRSKQTNIIWMLCVTVLPLCVLVLLLLYVKNRCRKRTRRTRIEVPPPDNDDVSDGNAANRRREENEEDSLLTASPPSSYHSCKSDDSMLSVLSNDENIGDERPPSSIPCGRGEAQESGL